jgi:hypothetical protein
MHTFTFCEVWYVFRSYGPVFEIPSKNFIDRLEMGHAVTQLVEALRYKPEGCGFDS